MLIDSTTVANDSVIAADICIIGAGPAGITLAREFLGSPVRVVLLESGTFEYDEQIQELGRGEIHSQYFGADALAEGRRRQFGGTPNRWVYTTEPGNGRSYARCVPPEAADFEQVAGDAKLCWPFSLAQLQAYYQRGQKVWNGGPYDYELDTWSGGLPALDSANGLLETRISQHGPKDVFTLRYRDDLIAAENIDLYLSATAVALESDRAANSAERLRVAGPNRRSFSVSAGIYVLACGGIENVQLLLCSDLTRPGAPGNRHDNIGRYVTDHPSFRIGSILPDGPDAYDRIALYDIRWSGRQMVSGFLTIADDVKRSEELLNMSVALAPRGAGFGTAAHRAIADLAAGARLREKPATLRADLRSILRSPVDAVTAAVRRNAGHYAETRGGWSRPEVDRRLFRAIELWFEVEQTPERENRLSLADDLDWLGRRKVRFDHTWSPSDRANVKRSVNILAKELESTGLGRFQQWDDPDGPHRPRFPGFHHPMGGTRMDTDPRTGAVDENCLVHGLSNVYVAGSSVFATSIGYANPTLTLLALATRLADHLKERLP